MSAVIAKGQGGTRCLPALFLFAVSVKIEKVSGRMRAFSKREESKFIAVAFRALKKLVKPPFEFEHCEPGELFEKEGLAYNAVLRNRETSVLYLFNISLAREQCEWDLQLKESWFTIEEGGPVSVNVLSLQLKLADVVTKQIALRERGFCIGTLAGKKGKGDEDLRASDSQ